MLKVALLQATIALIVPQGSKSDREEHDLKLQVCFCSQENNRVVNFHPNSDVHVSRKFMFCTTNRINLCNKVEQLFKNGTCHIQNLLVCMKNNSSIFFCTSRCLV